MKNVLIARHSLLLLALMALGGCAGLFGPPEPAAPIEDRTHAAKPPVPRAPTNESAVRTMPLPERPRMTVRPLAPPPATPAHGAALPPGNESESLREVTPSPGFRAEPLPPEPALEEHPAPVAPGSESSAAAPIKGSASPLSPAVQSLVAAANTASDQHNWDRAQAALERAVKLSPGKSVLWLQLAYTHLQSGNLERAREVAQRALTLAANDGRENTAAWRLIGDIEQARGDTAAAQAARANAAHLNR